LQKIEPEIPKLVDESTSNFEKSQQSYHTSNAEVEQQTGLPDFSWPKHTKMGKIYQTTTHYTKRP
jgi:hypothetical protein